MSFVHGYNCQVCLNGTDLSSFFNSTNLSLDVDTAETTTFRNRWKTFIEGPALAVVSMEGYYDSVAATGLFGTVQATAGDILTVFPQGSDTVGNQARLVQVRTTSLTKSAPVGDVVAMNWAVTADSVVGFGSTLHPLTEETSSDSGTSVDNTTSSANGALIHLHVTGVSDEITVTVEDSANNADWSTLHEFTSVSAVGGTRVTVSGTIDRYIRVSWTLPSSQTATFCVALARL